MGDSTPPPPDGRGPQPLLFGAASAISLVSIVAPHQPQLEIDGLASSPRRGTLLDGARC